MSAELDALLALLDKKESAPLCNGCFMHCEPSKTKKAHPYPCSEPLRKWAAQRMWSMGIYEEQE